MRQFTDQLSRTITLTDEVKRIVSVVPSQTELLFDLGLEDGVVGITRFCVRPQSWFKIKTRVGGTKQLKLDVIRELQSDLILANKEENTEEQIAQLADEFPVWVSDVHHLDDALNMIASVGEMTNTTARALQIISDIRQGFGEPPVTERNQAVAYLIWRNPMMVAGGDTFIQHMLTRFGKKNVFANLSRYPTVTADQLRVANPEFIFLSSEPFPFSEKHLNEFRSICPDAQVVLVDGQMFSWYGSRLLYVPKYFSDLKQSLRIQTTA